jgi:hypothetical protein
LHADKPNEVVLYVGIQFDDNLVKWTIGPVALNSVGVCFREQCSSWSKCLRMFNREYILSVDLAWAGVLFVACLKQNLT